MSTANQWVIVGNVSYGKGVFARQSIPQGTILGPVIGKVIDDPTYASAYCIDLGDSLSLEPCAPFRYLNHRCEPNCVLQVTSVVYDDGTIAPSEVHIETLTDIAEGAELTIDYKWSAEGAIRCLCGADRCRGWVVAAEELPRVNRFAKSRRTKPAVGS